MDSINPLMTLTLEIIFVYFIKQFPIYKRDTTKLYKFIQIDKFIHKMLTYHLRGTHYLLSFIVLYSYMRMNSYLNSLRICNKSYFHYIFLDHLNGYSDRILLALSKCLILNLFIFVEMEKTINNKVIVNHVRRCASQYNICDLKFLNHLTHTGSKQNIFVKL